MTIEEMFDELPMKVVRHIKTKCPRCNQSTVIRAEYELRIDIYQIDGHKQYSIYYKLAGYNPYNPDIPAFIYPEHYEKCSKTLAEAIEGIRKEIENDKTNNN